MVCSFRLLRLAMHLKSASLPILVFMTMPIKCFWLSYLSSNSIFTELMLKATWSGVAEFLLFQKLTSTIPLYASRIWKPSRFTSKEKALDTAKSLAIFENCHAYKASLFALHSFNSHSSVVERCRHVRRYESNVCNVFVFHVEFQTYFSRHQGSFTPNSTST